jgi:hypothetical protein
MKQPTRRFACIAIALISFIATTYSMGIIEAFYKFPVEIAFQLPSSQKTALLTSYFSNQPAVASSRYNTPVQLMMVDTIGNYMQYQTSAASTTELKTITATNGKTYIFHNAITCGPVCDSHITVFDENWYYVPIQRIAPALVGVQISLFFDVTKATSDGIDLSNLLTSIRPIFYELNFAAQHNDLLVTLHLNALPETTRQQLLPYYQQTIRLSWNGERFE